MLKNLRAEHPLPRPVRLADRQVRRNSAQSQLPAHDKRRRATPAAYYQPAAQNPNNFSVTFSTRQDNEDEDDVDHIRRDVGKSNQRHNNDNHRSTINTRQLLHRNPPFFIAFISIFQLCTFVFYAFRSEQPITFIGPVPFQSRLIFNPYRRYEIWRYLTYMLIHAGYWHISFNILIQLAVGVPLETVHSFTPVFVVYTGGIVGGALGNSIADPHSYLAGASSGCYALIAAHLSELIINWNEIKGACLKLVSFIVFCSADIATAVYERHYRGSIAYRTSYGGHLAGAVSGLLLGLVYLRNAKVHPWETKVSRFAGVLYVTLIVSFTPITRARARHTHTRDAYQSNSISVN